MKSVRLTTIACLLLILSVTSGASCQKPSPALVRSQPSLLVAPDFNDKSLPAPVGIWSDRFWAQINNPQQFPNATDMAKSNDTYQYGRALNTHITSLLQVLRVTGDRRLLAEIDRLAQLMRAQLKDSSITTYKGTVYQADGYLNWQYFYDEGYHGTDAHIMDEMLSHSLVAAMAYAFHVNRSLEPRYAERALFWTDYLKNHFEAKWRARKSLPTGFPFLTFGLSHVYLQWIRYHYYMHKLTGEPAYQVEALRMAAVMDRHLQSVSTPQGKAFQWSHGMPELDQPAYEAQRMNYARYTVQAAADLSLEGFDIFARPGFMEGMSTMLAVFIMDREAPESFAARVDGRGEEREKLSRYVYSPFCQLGYWDDSGRVSAISKAAYERFEADRNVPKCIHIPAGMYFSLMRSGAAVNQQDGDEGPQITRARD